MVFQPNYRFKKAQRARTKEARKDDDPIVSAEGLTGGQEMGVSEVESLECGSERSDGAPAE